MNHAALAQERKLSLYNVHTQKTIDVTFWRDGQFDHSGIKKLQYFLRDWRNEGVRPMDPELFMLVHKIHQKLVQDYPDIADKPIHVLSGYRTKETNRILKWNGRNVARNSMHTHGQAMDIKIPGVPSTRLRDVALSFEVGGVGFYPNDGFVHVDTGRFRQW